MSWLCPRCDSPFVDRSTSCSDCGAPLVEDLRGTVLAGRYRLESILGTGAQESTVWKAFQVSFERAVAVKLMPGGDNTAQERFARGAKIASRLNHQNTTTVHDYGRTEDGKVYLVMELLTGRTLRQELKKGEGMPVDRAVHVASQVLRALEDAHAHSVVHRDLKPDNLFLMERAGDPDFVKVLDFGIAKFFAEPPPGEAPAADTIDGQITRGWQLCGTPLYMAPEQISGEAVGAYTDIYALGVVLYQMLLGRVPFRAKTQYAVLSQHLRDPPPPFATVRPDLDVPEALERVVMKSLSKDRGERFESAREMRYALRDVQDVMGLAVEATDESDRTGSRLRRPVTAVQMAQVAQEPKRERRMLPLLLVVLFAMAVGAGIAMFAISETRSEDTATPRRATVTDDVRSPGAAAPATVGGVAGESRPLPVQLGL